MDPTRYPGQLSKTNRQSRRNEYMAQFHPEPELMDECANQEAPIVSNAFQFMGTADKENTVSSGYLSGASSTQQFYGEPFIHDTLEHMDISYPTPSKRNVGFTDEILPPALKRLKRLDSSSSRRQVLREVQMADVSMEDINAPRPSLTRSVTVPFPSPAPADSTARLSLEKPKPVLPVIKTSTHGTDMVLVNFSSDESDSEDDLSEERRSEEGRRQSCDDENIPLAPVPEADPNAPPIHLLIFHCEFSSQRGPELSRFLRKVDRYINYPRYPFVFYPYVYVMYGGYASFYKEYPELCEPRNYLKMFEKGYKDVLTYYSKLAKEVSSACTACFKDSNLVNLRISPSMEDKEKKPALRSVQTMLPGPPLKKIGEIFEGTPANVHETSPKRKGVSRRYLQLAEHIIRKGSHVIDAYEYFRQMGTDELANEMLVGFVPTKSEESRVFGTLSGPRKPVARLSFSSDDDLESMPSQQPSVPRPKAVLDFSDSDEPTDASGCF
nr:hypothetical transcript [Hymenolepis microstoma]